MEYPVPTLVPERRHEVWHDSDGGDWRIAYFDVPLPTRFQATDFRERVQREYQVAVTKWAEMLARENEVPTTAPYLAPGVYFCPEPDRQDYRRFYMAARVKKTRPDVYPVDSVARLAEAKRSQDYDERVIREFFQQMQGFREGKADPAAVEKQAQDNKSLPKRIEAQRKGMKRAKKRGYRG